MSIKQNFKPIAEPRPMAVYFKNIRRGHPGVIRAVIREYLPSWALLGLHFIGSSVLEIVTDERLKDRTISTLKIIGITQIPNFDNLATAPNRAGPGESSRNQRKGQLKSAAYQMQRNIGKTHKKWAASWYKAALKEVTDKLREI